MIRILDRMLFLSFIRGYFICLISTLSLYIIVDLFTNLDEFARPGKSFLDVLMHLLGYYGYRTLEYYDRLCEVISLLAAMFAIAWIQRNNELIPMLSAGVSTHRVLRPILLGAVLMLSVGIFNQEMVIPRIASALVAEREDPDGAKEIGVQGAFDSSGVHIEGIRAYRRDLLVKPFFATMPETSQSQMRHITAAYAIYVPPQDNKPLSGGWELYGASPDNLAEDKIDTSMLTIIDRGRYFLKVKDATFEGITSGGKKTLALSSTTALRAYLDRTEPGRMNTLAVTYHMRLTRPLVGMLLVIMGISIILRDQTRHIFISTGLCLGLCATFFAAIFASRFMGNADIISPALSGWLPVIVFTPLAIALYDAIHT
ncbi:MAG: LptF/LptG family permease [Zavarzinella sp.]